MKKWKYRRRGPAPKTLAKADDKRLLAHHHHDVPGKYKAKAEKAAVKHCREMKVYRDTSTHVYSSQATHPGWQRSKCWFRKPQ